MVLANTVHKDAMGVVQWTTRLETAPRRLRTDKAIYKVPAWELIQSRKEAALLRMQFREATEVEKGRKQVAECSNWKVKM